jgi:cytochrome c
MNQSAGLLALLRAPRSLKVSVATHTFAALGLSLCFFAQAGENEDLARAKNCMACHALDHKVVGPGYQDVAKKYAGDNSAQARLATKILKGGGGVWGVIPMPANSQLTQAEANKLAAWVLSLR